MDKDVQCLLLATIKRAVMNASVMRATSAMDSLAWTLTNALLVTTTATQTPAVATAQVDINVAAMLVSSETATTVLIFRNA